MNRTLRDVTRRSDPTSRRRDVRPAVEGLEDRLLLWAANGGLWTYGSRITYSFVPDGTNVLRQFEQPVRHAQRRRPDGDLASAV
jgi:hypothetical protein